MWLTIILILVGVVAMAVGPIMWMRPSKFQRRISALRSFALAQGLRVHMSPVPDRDDNDLIAVYCLPWGGENKERKQRLQKPENASWCLVKVELSHEIHFSGHWDWAPSARASGKWQRALKDVLGDLPSGVEAIEMSHVGLCFYWRENGDNSVVERIKSLLEKLQAQL